MESKVDLIAKYDIPAPRYTSYPTVPYWSDSPDTETWLDQIRNSISAKDSKISLYIHIPFCETLCTFCGCNTSVTKNHSVEEPYVEHLLKEFSMYLDRIPEIRNTEINEIHFGGGSPTYLSEENLKQILSGILENVKVANEKSFAIEVDPRRTRKTQLETLREYGFRRISLGVQDFNPEVQRLINRDQPFEKTEFVTKTARDLGYDSVNFDLIYGLPRQTLSTMNYTIEKTLELVPDRIAFYSYAHVPWIKASQRLFTEADLPSGPEKRKLYESGRDAFERKGYKEIGMDHFALPTDSLWTSFLKGKLHRNFMGYTESKSDIQLGLGVSAISDAWTCFHQNEKILKKYQRKISEGSFPTLRGHILNEEDLAQRKLILDLATKWTVDLPKSQLDDVKSYLSTMEGDGLIEWKNENLRVTEKGKPFLRNICMALDLRMRRKSPDSKVFSQAI
ncbi:MAG: oxygen-independent coproporphyrinogen III oxidase [Leptospiraceae bacterium]|nr:oxygen-independent coproporphyrinogen III oxidase [Leptospiraceae bacterium]MCP5511096.1 oxygen-independent coproporphyrinogen III oxidase [Leptospiraceae bacterium]